MCLPTTDFLAWVQNLIPHDKFKTFKTLFRYPVRTNEVTGICFDKLSRIFDGRNPAFNYQFQNTEQRDDWEYYRQDVLKEPEIWSTKGWEFFKTEINSVLIVDLPAEQNPADRYPTPYFYWLPIESVITFEANRTTGVMDWIIFRQPDKRIAVIDDERYRVFAEDDGGNIGELLVDNPHDLRYCPARFFWNEPMNLRDPDVKQSPLTKELEALDWFLFFHISKRHLDMYGAYPIYSGYEQSCDFTNAENGDYCDGGFLKDKQGYYRLDQAGLLMRCPKCGDKRITGAGSFVFQFYLSSIKSANARSRKLGLMMFQFYLSSIKRHVPTLGRLGKINEAVQPLGAFAQYLNRDAVALAYADRLTGQPFRFRQQRVGRERKE